MKAKLIRSGILVLMIVGLIGTLHIGLSAVGYEEFSVRAIIPENQVDKSKSYFDLRLTPNMEQEIQVTVTNSGDKVMKAEVGLNDATTGHNGTIIYSQPGDRDKSLSLSTTDVTTVLDKEVMIEPRESKNVRLKIVMPDKEYDGNILGGVVISGSVDADTKKSEGDAVAIENEISYVVGLNLSMNEIEVSSNLNLKKIKEKLVDHRISVAANLQNDCPVIMSNVKISGTIKKIGSDAVLSNVDINGVKIAPNTNFDVVYDWDTKAIENGTYRIQMRAEYLEDVWEWDEEFEIKDASKVNEETLFKEEKETNWILVIGIVAVLATALGVILTLLIGKKRRIT